MLRDIYFKTFFVFNLILSALDNLRDLKFYYNLSVKEGNSFRVFKYYWVETCGRAAFWTNVVKYRKSFKLYFCE